MTAALFKDWAENCCVPELKTYCRTQNIDFKMLILVDNAPSHPIYLDEISANVKFIFMPPNTTSIIQPMDQGVISNFKCYYLRRTFSHLLESTDGNDKPTMKEFWKNYNILMAIENISHSWMEVKKTYMNGVWRQLWTESVSKDVEVDILPTVRKEIAELAREADFEGMEEDDINEILISHDKELNNEDLISLNIEHSLVDDIDSHDVVPEEKHLTAGSISKAMQLISQAMDIFADNDPDENRSLNVTRAIDNAINCYKEIYLEKKAGKVQQTLDNFVTKSVREPNQSTEIMIDLESSSSSN